MRFRRHKRVIPGLNTTSTADISFMLLIFFLVTTSMDADKAIMRRLPPAEREPERQESRIEESKLLDIVINSDNTLQVNERPLDIHLLRESVEEFVKRVGREHMIRVISAPDATYDAYFQVQNELMEAYQSVRDRYALKRFGHAFDRCSQAEQETAVREFPRRISETYDLEGKGGGQ